MSDTEGKRGYVQVYTGECKGKTTAALGLAFRAAGHGLKTYIGQFMKGQEYGELRSAHMIKSLITIEQYGNERMIDPNYPPEKANMMLAKAGLETCKKAMFSGMYDIVVFDEICYACFFHLINIEDVIEMIKLKPPEVEVILTGRYAPQELIAIADLVTDMKQIKHYYCNGVLAREGIEN